MNTLARQHYARVTAAEASGSTEPGLPIDATAYELVLAQLGEDRRRLKQVQSIERKIEVKRQMLPTYLPWIEGALEAGRGGQDAVLTTMMVWAIDTGEQALALRIAAYVLEHKLAMPDQYQRGAATIVAEEIADQALAAFGTGVEFALDALEGCEQLTRTHDMPDEVRAKLHKALGLCIAQKVEASTDDTRRTFISVALEHLRRALQLSERIGVKKDIERLERALKNTPINQSAERDASAGSLSHADASAPETTG